MLGRELAVQRCRTGFAHDSELFVPEVSTCYDVAPKTASRDLSTLPSPNGDEGIQAWTESEQGYQVHR